jgi:predicted NAD/FAD-binding protein
MILYWQEVAYLLACYAWFSICCFFVAPTSSRPYGSETLEEYLRRIWLPAYFATYYLLPLISSVTTCPHDALLRFPASDLIDYKRRTHRAPHYTVSNGVNTVQKKLVDGINFELSAMVKAVDPQGGQVILSWRKVGESHGPLHQESFNRVVLAVAPDIVGEVFRPLKHSMAKIPTALVESVVHTDNRTLVANDDERASSGNGNTQLIYLRTSIIGATRTESLHVQPGGSIVTTCPYSPIDPALLIHSAKFTRVLRSPESRCIVNSIFGDTPHFSNDEKVRISWRNGDNNIWLVGGWCWDGMVLLEGCIVSAMRVADAFGVQVPWRQQVPGI